MFIHYMYVDILFPLWKAIPIMCERVTTHYQTLWIWIGHSATRYHTRYHTLYRTFSLSLTQIGHNPTHYHNLNLLPHVLPYILCKFSMVWGLFATVYHALPSNLQKKRMLIFKKKTVVTPGNPLQIVPQIMLNGGKKYGNACGNMLKLW